MPQKFPPPLQQKDRRPALLPSAAAHFVSALQAGRQQLAGSSTIGSGTIGSGTIGSSTHPVSNHMRAAVV